MNIARPIVLMAVAALGAFYVYVGGLAWRPQVGNLYRLHFIEQNLREWNHGEGPRYQLGQTIDFRRLQPYLSRRGLGQPEHWGTWSDGRSAELHLRFVASERPSRIVLQAMPFTVPAKGIGSQSFAVYANGHPLGKRTIGSPQELSIEIPESALLDFDGLLRLGFEFHDAASPKQLGISNDGRRLGLGLIRLTVL